MPEQLYKPISLFVKLSDYCPNNCFNGKYCFTGCTPDASRATLDKDKIPGILKEAKELGFIELAFISSEPFTKPDLLYYVTEQAASVGIVPRFLVTNGRIGESFENARACFQGLKDSGFSIKLPEDYFGSDYNGIDVSVDQFHNIPPICSANTILSALEVFGPTADVAIRTTYPAKKYRDITNLKKTIDLLVQSGKVKGKRRRDQYELFFYDKSRVVVTKIPADKFGNAKALADDYFQMTDWREVLGEYKDLRERCMPFRFPYPYHKLYLDPDGSCYPELCRLKALSGGNAYTSSLKTIIDDIDNNPITVLLISLGLYGLLRFIKDNFNQRFSTIAPNCLSLTERVFENQELIERTEHLLRTSGVVDVIRERYSEYLMRIRNKKTEIAKIKRKFRPRII